MSILLNKEPITINEFPYYKFDMVNEVVEEISNDFTIQGKIYNKQNKYVKNANIQTYSIQSFISTEFKQNLFETIYSQNFFWIDTKKPIGKIIDDSFNILYVQGDLCNSFPFDINDPEYEKESLYIIEDRFNTIYEVSNFEEYNGNTKINFVYNQNPSFDSDNFDLIGANFSIVKLVYNTNKEYTLNMINEDKFKLNLNVNSINLIIENEVFNEKYYNDFEINKKDYIDFNSNPEWTNSYYHSIINNEKEKKIEVLSLIEDEDGSHSSKSLIISTYEKTEDINIFDNTKEINLIKSIEIIKDEASIFRQLINKNNKIITSCAIKSSQLGSEYSILKVKKFNLENLIFAYNKEIETNLINFDYTLPPETEHNSSYIPFFDIKEDIYNNDYYTIIVYNSTYSKQADPYLFSEIKIDFKNNILVSRIDKTPASYNTANEITMLHDYDWQIPGLYKNFIDFNKECFLVRYQENAGGDTILSFYSSITNNSVNLDTNLSIFLDDLKNENVFSVSTSCYFNNELEQYYISILYEYEILLVLDSNLNLIKIYKDDINPLGSSSVRVYGDESGQYVVHSSSNGLIVDKHHLIFPHIEETINNPLIKDIKNVISIYENELTITTRSSSMVVPTKIKKVNLDTFEFI